MKKIDENKVVEILDEITSVSCNIDCLDFLQRAMINDGDGCTPATLMDNPLNEIKYSLEKIEKFLNKL